METLKLTPETEIFLRITRSLLTIPGELEVLGHELSGKPEAAGEKFRTLNLEFLAHVLELKKIIHQLPLQDSIEIQSILFTLEELLSRTINNNLQLSRHKTNIVDCLLSLEQRLTNSLHDLPSGKIFLHEMETFKLKLEILRLRFLVGNYVFRNKYHQEMKTARGIAEKLVKELTQFTGTRYHCSTPTLERKIRKAYRHMKEAIRNV